MTTRPSIDSVGSEVSAQESCRVVWLGTVPYRDAWDLQVEIAGRVRRGAEPETLLLLEHPHTYTRGVYLPMPTCCWTMRRLPASARWWWKPTAAD